jgi:hypothetical protein
MAPSDSMVTVSDLEMRRVSIPLPVATSDKYYPPKVESTSPTRQALTEFVCNSVWIQPNSSLRQCKEWSTENVELYIHLGSGQLATPYTISHEEFEDRCKIFTPGFLQKLYWKRSQFEYCLHYEEKPTVLELGISTYENDSFMGLFRYDIQQKKIYGNVFCKSSDHINIKPINIEDFYTFLECRKEFLIENPLMIVTSVLDFMQRRGQNFVRWRVSLYGLESSLGVTGKTDILKYHGYPDISDNYDVLNAELASLGGDVANSELSMASILFLAKEFSKVVKFCETGTLFPSIQIQEVDSIISRAELYLRHMKMCKDTLHGLTAVLYNRINQRESYSMKTIAVATLIFLPATFVSTIFGVGIFDFHAYQGQNPTTVSKYWIIYFTICTLLTALTLAIWTVWYKWGSRWVRRRKPDLESQWTGQRVEEEVLLRDKQSELSTVPWTIL